MLLVAPRASGKPDGRGVGHIASLPKTPDVKDFDAITAGPRGSFFYGARIAMCVVKVACLFSVGFLTRKTALLGASAIRRFVWSLYVCRLKQLFMYFLRAESRIPRQCGPIAKFHAFVDTSRIGEKLH